MAAVLDVRPVVLGDGGHVEAVATFDHFDLLVAQGFAGRGFVFDGILTSVVFLLSFEDGGGEDLVHVSIGHGFGSIG